MNTDAERDQIADLLEDAAAANFRSRKKLDEFSAFLARLRRGPKQRKML